MNIMVSVVEFIKVKSGYKSKTRLIPLDSAKVFFPLVDFKYYTKNVGNLDFQKSTEQLSVKPNYKKKELDITKWSFFEWLRYKAEELRYGEIGGKRRLVKIFNVGNLIAYWNFSETKDGNIVCQLIGEEITTSQSRLTFYILSVEFDKNKKHLIFHSSNADSYISKEDILLFNTKIKVKHYLHNEYGHIHTTIVETKDGKTPVVRSKYMLQEHDFNEDISGIPVMINNIDIQNNKDFMFLAESFIGS